MAYYEIRILREHLLEPIINFIRKKVISSAKAAEILCIPIKQSSTQVEKS